MFQDKASKVNLDKYPKGTKIPLYRNSHFPTPQLQHLPDTLHVADGRWRKLMEFDVDKEDPSGPRQVDCEYKLQKKKTPLIIY